MEEWERKHIKGFVKIIDGISQKYSDSLFSRDEEEGMREGKRALGDVIRYMDMSDSELVEKLYPILNEFVEGIVNWDKDKAQIAACNMKSIHQAIFDKAKGVSKESLTQIYNMMP